MTVILKQRKDESFILFKVESFVLDVMSVGLYPSMKQQLIELITQFDLIYNIDYQYSDYILSFVHLKSIIDLKRYSLHSPLCDSYTFIDYICVDEFNVYAQEIKTFKLKIENALYQFYRQEKENEKRLVEYMKKLFYHYRKLLIVRVNLFYHEKLRDEINITKFDQDFRVLRNRLSNKDTCFRNLQGYVWAMEQAETCGYHIHLLLIYDGALHRSGVHFAMLVGQKWQEITQGRGAYFSCHDKSYLEQLQRAGCKIGIGPISREVSGDWERLESAFLYLVKSTKDAQRMRVKLKDMRTFHTGRFEIKKRRGIRPR
ncbi:YagK/YfjJ domain-containing protein [Acinetobacter higginsii]|uniref:YagK/YfjJ domain-containing protein n=1 Tax=Acinetobacter higginsii TaxID=70347 RepID=UPI001F4A6A86|nr:inovirus-type Gp2 protein [Acinetobacter higginsii]MCH7294424.1 inovirus Gp2 family protein [Acinetobacter higginsii]